jgi:uncharacterized membrane protein
MYCGNYGGFMGMDGFGVGLGLIFTLLFWALIIWAVISLIQYFARPREERGHHKRGEYGEYGPRHWDRYGYTYRDNKEADRENARWVEILKERYAKGEISKEEYDQKRADIEKMR